MSRKLISLNPELQLLLDEGYEIEVRHNHLLMRGVPYVNVRREIARGVIVAPISLASPDKLGRPSSHQVYFIGEHPCRPDGSVLEPVQCSSGSFRLAEDIEAQHHFSNKPPRGHYESFYEQFTSYARVISNQAKAIDPDADARTFKPVDPMEETSVFLYEDTASSRAGIRRLAMGFAALRVAIVGLGGTGGYLLDLVAKTHVAEIHLFDGDVLQPHNAFRTPGAVARADLESKVTKVAYLAERYGCMRRAIMPHPVMIEDNNVHLLRDLDYVFLCVDKGEVRQLVLRELHGTPVTVIDVGMGLHLTDNQDAIWGTCRVTTSTPDTRELAQARIPKVDGDEELYASNIQIADFNCLNAALAVMKWKRLCGFYLDDHAEYETTYSANLNQISRQEPLP